MLNRFEFLKKTALGSLAATGLSTLLPTGIVERGRDSFTLHDSLTVPRQLQPGDTVAFTSPAGILYEESDFEKMEGVMRGFGLHVIFGEHVRRRFGYFAGTDRQRAEDLNRMFADPEVDAIVAVRGGWGSSRILPYLDYEMIRRNPKILVGFSDITTLHLALLKRCGLVTYHGPNGASDWSDLTRRNFVEVLMGRSAWESIEGSRLSQETQPEGDGPGTENNPSQAEGLPEFRSAGRMTTITPGIASGTLIGGNLTIFTTALGTWYHPETEGGILFLEDISEPVYKIDRMLTHIREAGILEKINGFVFGDCMECPAPRSDHFTMQQIIRQHIEPLGIPAIMGASISHGPDNFTLPVGLKAELDAGEGVMRLVDVDDNKY